MVLVAALPCSQAWSHLAVFPRPSVPSHLVVTQVEDKWLVKRSRQRKIVKHRETAVAADSGDSGPGNSSSIQELLWTEKNRRAQPSLQERRGGQLLRRYRVDDQSGLLCVEVDEEGGNTSDELKLAANQQERLGVPIRLPQFLRDFFLPSGFPDSVSSDYLSYMLWQLPTNVTGWICSTLVTSSLLKAVGIGGGGGSAAAAAASIKWVTKDGLGAVGRLFIGGRFGSLFDEDPKQWRMYADFIGSAGSIFELSTPLAPGNFLLLASLGNLAKAIAKGLKDPSFRVIQNHFAVAENVGDVAAKEEVWGVAAQLVGLGLGVLLLGSPGISTSYWELVTTWAFIRLLHLWLRYQSLAILRFPTINYKRAVILIEAHIAGLPVPGCEECNFTEQLLVPRPLMWPRVHLGCSLQDLLGPQPSALEVEELLDLYQVENYLLVLHPTVLHSLEARILFKEGATSTTLMRGLWQACWLLRQDTRARSEPVRGAGKSGLVASFEATSNYNFKDQRRELSKSVHTMEQCFDAFLDELQEQGWDFSKLVLKIPSNAPLLSAIQDD